MTHASTHTPPADERTLAVAGNLALMRGFMGMKQTAYSLIITDRRLIFAEFTKAMMSETVSQARDQAKAQGKGVMGRWSAQLRGSATYHERYRGMPPAAALAESPGNFAIDRAIIRKVKFKEGSFEDTHSTLERLIIKTSSGKYKLHVRGSLSAAREAFRAAGIS